MVLGVHDVSAAETLATTRLNLTPPRTSGVTVSEAASKDTVVGEEFTTKVYDYSEYRETVVPCGSDLYSDVGYKSYREPVTVLANDGVASFCSASLLYKSDVVNKVVSYITDHKDGPKRELISFTAGDKRYQFNLDSIKKVAHITESEVRVFHNQIKHDLCCAFGQKWALAFRQGDLKLSAVHFLMGGSTFQRWHCDRELNPQCYTKGTTEAHPCVLLYALGGICGNTASLSTLNDHGNETVYTVPTGGIIYFHGNKIHRGVINSPENIRMYAHFDSQLFTTKRQYKDTYIMNELASFTCESKIEYQGTIIVCSYQESPSVAFLKNAFLRYRKSCYVLELFREGNVTKNEEEIRQLLSRTISNYSSANNYLFLVFIDNHLRTDSDGRHNQTSEGLIYSVLRRIHRHVCIYSPTKDDVNLSRIGFDMHAAQIEKLTKDIDNSIFLNIEEGRRNRAAKVELHVYGCGGRVVRISTVEPEGRQLHHIDCLCQCELNRSRFGFSENNHVAPLNCGTETCVSTYDKIVSCCSIVFHRMKQDAFNYAYTATKLRVELSLRENHFRLSLLEIDIFRGTREFFGGRNDTAANLKSNICFGNAMLDLIRKEN